MNNYEDDIGLESYEELYQEEDIQKDDYIYDEDDYSYDDDSDEEAYEY